MVMVWDTVVLINFLLCLITAILGFSKEGKRSKAPLMIAIAFSLFGISHLTQLMGYKEALEVVLIMIRTAAYVLVAVAMYI